MFALKYDDGRRVGYLTHISKGKHGWDVGMFPTINPVVALLFDAERAAVGWLVDTFLNRHVKLDIVGGRGFSLAEDSPVRPVAVAQDEIGRGRAAGDDPGPAGHRRPAARAAGDRRGHARTRRDGRPGVPGPARRRRRAVGGRARRRASDVDRGGAGIVMTALTILIGTVAYLAIGVGLVRYATSTGNRRRPTSSPGRGLSSS
jgi:hypothetical protein